MKYRSTILIWNRGTAFEDGPDRIAERDAVLPEEKAKQKYVALASITKQCIYISSNCKYKEVLWAHEKTHLDMLDATRTAAGRKKADPIIDEIYADVGAALLYGPAHTAKALRWVRDEMSKEPSEFRDKLLGISGFCDKLLKVRLRVIEGLAPMMVKCLKSVD